MRERLLTWDAALHRVLDVLAASAQPVIETGPPLLYRWGQHIRDDLGDNTGQYGLHGTSEAVRALAAGVDKLGSKSRYQRFLSGGVLSLTQWIIAPKKQLDLHKTVKISEWLGALSDGGGAKEDVDSLSGRLLSGRDPATGGWGWNPQNTADPLLLPSLYALDGLTRVHKRFGLYDEEIGLGIRFCLDGARMSIPAASADYEEIYTWKTCLYKLCEIVSLYERTIENATDFRPELESMLQSDSNLSHPALKEFKRLEYRIRTAPTSEEDHAYCVLPVGLMQLRAELWAQSIGLNIGLEQRQSDARAKEFIKLVYSPQAFPFNIVGSCAYAARLLAEFGIELDINLTPEPLRVAGETVITSAPAPTPVVADPFEEKTARERLYQELLSEEDTTQVEILKPLLGGYSGAHLDLCEITRTGGTQELLQVFKLDEARNVKQEEGGVEAAERYIDPKHRVHFIRSYPVPGSNKGVLRFEYVGLTPGRTQSFLSFLDAESSTDEVVKAIKAIYEKGLKQAQSGIRRKYKSLEKIKGYFERIRGNKYWAEVGGGYARLKQGSLLAPSDKLSRLLLEFPFKTVQDPFIDSRQRREVWEQLFLGADVSYAHGDLNPRNILIVKEEEGNYTPVLIDFHRFSPWVPLPIDFARLEAGIQVKGLARFIGDASTGEEQHEYLIKYEKWINGSVHLEEGSLRGIKLPAELGKVAQFIQAIRDSYITRVGGDNDGREYFAVLMLNYLSYLRPIYDRVLSREQKLFAFYSAACIFKRHFLYPIK